MEAIVKMDLFKLVKLQEIDKRLMELESFKGDLPEQVEDLKSKLSKIREQLLINKQDLEAAKKQNRAIEIDIRSLTDKLNKYQEQIYSVKTNKEYDAITLEIENLEQQIGETELKGVELLEKEEKLTGEVERLDEQISELEQHLNKKEFELREKLNQTNVEQNILMSERNDIIPTVDRWLLATYERIRKGRDGIALAEIENYICNACYATIPAQTVVEVRKMDKVITCEVCGRILVARNNHIEKPLEANSENIRELE
jgi:predicted  nucleic acid-binding Zn-ribbon protein